MTVATVAFPAALLLAALAPPPAPETGSAADVARKVEERAVAAADLEARFVQSYRSEALGREVVERGTLRLKRPGRMRWDYDAPDKKTFVSDGKTFYFYVPADKQVIVREQGGNQGLVSRLLSERGRILEPFDAGLESSANGLLRLRLTPKRPDPELERAYLQVDAEYRIRAIEILDAQGNRSRFDFDAIKENVGLADKLFRFEVPRGVEVISG
jgi:outer membrane lipoprotein carrier protein